MIYEVYNTVSPWMKARFATKREAKQYIKKMTSNNRQYLIKDGLIRFGYPKYWGIRKIKPAKRGWFNIFNN
jgi:hypothetical protein